MLMGDCGGGRMCVRSMSSTIPQWIDRSLSGLAGSIGSIGSFPSMAPSSPNETVSSLSSEGSISPLQLQMFNFNEMMMQSVNPGRPCGFAQRTSNKSNNYMDSYARYTCADQFRMGYQSLLSPPIQPVFEFVPGLYPGMREIPSWLKGLRLHKYTTMFQCLTYDQMMNLNEYMLDAFQIKAGFQVTQGARKKILQSIDKLKMRPQVIRAMFKDLCTGQCVRCVILNVRYLLNTPIKPYVPHYHEGLDYAEGHVTIDYINDENIPALIVHLVQRLHALIFQSRNIRVEEDYLLLMYAIFDRITNNEAFSEYQKRRVAQMKKTARRFATPQELRKHRSATALAHGGRCDSCQQRGVGSEWTRVFFPQRMPQTNTAPETPKIQEKPQPTTWEPTVAQLNQLIMLQRQRDAQAMAAQKAYAIYAAQQTAQNQTRQQNYQPAVMQNLGNKLRSPTATMDERRIEGSVRVTRPPVAPVAPMAAEPVVSNLPQYQSAQTTAAVAAATAASITSTMAPSFQRMAQPAPVVERNQMTSKLFTKVNPMSVKEASDWSHFTIDNNHSLFDEYIMRKENNEGLGCLWSTAKPTVSQDNSISDYSSSTSPSERSSGSVSPDASSTVQHRKLDNVGICGISQLLTSLVIQ